MQSEGDRIAKLPEKVETLLRHLVTASGEVEVLYASRSETDTRRASIQKLLNAVFPAHLSLLFLREELLTPSWWVRPGRSLYSPQLVSIALTEFENHTKSSLLMSSFSATESTLRCIAWELCPELSAKSPFKRVYEGLLSAVNLSKAASATMDLFRLLRNSTHNNTVHCDRDTITCWRNVEYAFRNGHVIDFLTWEVLFNLIADVGEIMKAIVMHPSVQAPSLLIDPFAESAESKMPNQSPQPTPTSVMPRATEGRIE